MTERFRPYFPAIGLMLAAWVAIVAPLLTAFLVSATLFLLALAYAWIVHQLQKPGPGTTFRYRSASHREPSFRNVTSAMRTRWVRDLN